MNKIVLSLIIMLSIATSCTTNNKKQSKKEVDIIKSDKVTVYYFHNERRCATCQAIENVAKEAVSEINNPKVAIKIFNIGDTTNKQIVKELNISGQTLLVVGGKTPINITNEAFLNARTNPNKLKQIVKENITKFLE